MLYQVKRAFMFMLLSGAVVFVLWACGDGITVESVKGDGPSNFSIANHAAADVVIGQPDFIYGEPNQGGTTAADTIAHAYGNPHLHNGILFVSDWLNNRILGFNQVPVVNGAAADFVIGQPDFTSYMSGYTSESANGPQTIKTYDGKMFVSMQSSSSVYIYNTIPIANGASADVIVGKPDFINSSLPSGTCTASSLSLPESLFVVDGKLLVADSRNYRVLIYNTIPIVNGASADLVLGQPDLDTCTLYTGPPTASTLKYPTDVWSDGKRLVVADPGNERVLIWNEFPTQNGQPADVVLGQPDMTSDGWGVSDRDMSSPDFLASNGTQLFVLDSDIGRVLVWDSFPTENYASADRVLGQPDFTCGNYNENDGDCLTDGEGPGPRGLDWPTGLLLTDDMLMIGEYGNSRVLVFRE